MPKWIRKSFVVMVTILTFGLVTPSQVFLYEHSSSGKTPKRDMVEAVEDKNRVDSSATISEEYGYLNEEDFIKQIINEAEVQSYIKFGSRIKPVIEDEFSHIILPKIETAIQRVATQFPKDELGFLTVSENPGAGRSEKIFHIMNTKTNEDIIRFHVRRDHPPQQGYWFNFHYHTHHDQFLAHHELGSIYWDKNTPPKWMS